MPRIRCLLFAAMALTLPGATDALAWNRTGHMLTALVAYDALPDDRRHELVALLRRHPRFNEDFVRQMPPSVTERADQDRWIFAQASTWPDIARGFKGQDRDRYHHSEWHYVNVPVWMGKPFTPASAPVRGPGASRRSAAPEQHIQEAFERSVAELRDPGRMPEVRAVALCWILHLVGDVHQPLHCAALFDEDWFPSGDKGGNSIPTAGQFRNLHSTWDSLLGEAESLTVQTRKVMQLRTNAASMPRDPFPAAPADTEGANRMGADAKIFAAWIAEGRDLAERVAYGAEVRAGIEKSREDPEQGLVPIKLSKDYVETAKRLAEQRIVTGGDRLAGVLR